MHSQSLRLCILAAFAILMIYLQIYDIWSVDRKPPECLALKLDRNELAEEFLSKYGKSRVIDDTVCMKIWKHCVQVLDSVKKNEDGRYLFYRTLMYDNKTVTIMSLMPPERRHKNYLDTTKWTVDKTSTALYYILTLMIEQMFVNGAVEMDGEVKANVLIIGLGAGYVNTYLHHKYPKMNITVVDIESGLIPIAEKWFGLVLDDMQRVLIMDGIEFIREAVRKGDKYDAVYVDACVTNRIEKISCPAPGFYTSGTAENLSKILTRKGVVIIDILSRYLTQAETIQKVLFNYKMFFKNCITTKPEKTRMNRVAACFQHERPENLKEKYEKFIRSTS